jgi:hypothetical protein
VLSAPKYSFYRHEFPSPPLFAPVVFVPLQQAVLLHLFKAGLLCRNLRCPKTLSDAAQVKRRTWGAFRKKENVRHLR